MPDDPKADAPITVYTAAHPAPALPRQSIFTYLFPEAPVRSSSFQQLVARDRIPADRPAQVDPLTSPPRVWTRGQVLSNALRLAAGLRAPRTRGAAKGSGSTPGLGLEKGDVVGLVGLNSLEWLNAMYGSWAAGLRVSPVNYA